MLAMAIAIPDEVRALLEEPNFVHLSTLRADGSPRNWVVWVGLDGDHTRPAMTRSRAGDRASMARAGGA
jgi:hypothetical protein